ETIRLLREKPAHAHATIGFHVVDIEEDRVLLNENSDLAMVPGSIQKIYSTATVLDLLGPDYRFATPVYRNGDIVEGTLEGDLVLVASGDFNFGLRDQPDGTLGYNNMPEIDHNYADTGFAGGALVEGSDPLRALRQLAKEVRE